MKFIGVCQRFEFFYYFFNLQIPSIKRNIFGAPYSKEKEFTSDFYVNKAQSWGRLRLRSLLAVMGRSIRAQPLHENQTNGAVQSLVFFVLNV